MWEWTLFRMGCLLGLLLIHYSIIPYSPIKQDGGWAFKSGDESE